MLIFLTNNHYYSDHKDRMVKYSPSDVEKQDLPSFSATCNVKFSGHSGAEILHIRITSI